MRGIATLILAAAMVIGSLVCASASEYPRDVPPSWGIVDDIGSLSCEPMPDGELGPFLGPIGPQSDILFGALHNSGAHIAGNVGAMPDGELGPFLGPIGPQSDILFGALHNSGAHIAGNVGAMPDGELGPFLGPIGPQSDILFGALHNGGAHIAGNVGALSAGPMPNPDLLDEGVMPGPCPDVLFGGAGANCGAC